MGQSSPFFGFSLRDTLTRLVPGLLFLIPLVIGIGVIMPDILPRWSLLYIVLGLSGYLIGELIDLLRSNLFRVPMSFQYFIYKETDNIGKMPRWYIWMREFKNNAPNIFDFGEENDEDSPLIEDLELDFRKDIESELGIDFADNRPRDIYDLLLIYMDDHFTPRLRRSQSISMFATNIRIAAIGSLAVYTSFAIVYWRNDFVWSIWGSSLLIALLVTVLWSLLTVTHYHYSELLFKEYYMKRHEDREE